MNSIIENQRENKNRTYLFFGDAKKYFDKLWLKDCFIEMYYLWYSPGTIRSLYEINKTLNIIVDTPVGKASSITVEEVVKKEPYMTQLCVVYQYQKLTQYKSHWNISMVKWKKACQSLWTI